MRNKLTETGTLRRVMKAFDWQLQMKGYLPMSGEIVDATLVPAPKQRNNDAEKEGDCREFRVWAAIMDPEEDHDGTTQISPHS